MRCSDCVHYEVCQFENRLAEVNTCRFFKPKSRFVELPCEVGQKVYDITEFICKAPSPEMYELKANEMTVEQGAEGGLNFVYDGLYINCEDIGKTVFFTKEEAEKALAERRITMARYIDADALKRRIYASPMFFHFGEDGFFIRDAVLDLIDKFPAEKTTADVVEVVRCKDCKNFCPYEGEEHKGDCAELVGLESCVYEDDFCSYGEKSLKEREQK